MSDSNTDYTVLSDWSSNGEQTHQQIAEKLIPELKEEMPEERYEVDFRSDLMKAVIQSILRDLDANLEFEDWYGMGFEEPDRFLDADAVSEAIAEQSKRYFEFDQTGKSWDVLQVILEYAEEYDLVQLQEENSRQGECDLCEDESERLYTITSEPDLPADRQPRISICSGCHDALKLTDGDECAWCSEPNSPAVTVVETSEEDYTLGQLCLDCQGVENT